MTRFVWIALVLQLAMVLTGHYVEAVLLMSGALGTGIPFLIGLWYGAVVPGSLGRAAKGGFVIGIVGAVAGVLVAILMGDQGWILMTFAPLSSAVTGLLGAIIGLVAAGRTRRMEETAEG
jgi:hypothetical protein